MSLIFYALLTGLLAGAVHVWAGPDHLAAIAPLAVRRPRRSWLPGLRWGIGHTAGVGLVGLLFLLLRDLIPVAWLSAWGERLVGVLLMGIGFWALRVALRHNLHTHEHEHEGERHLHLHTHTHGHAPQQDSPHQHQHAAFGIGALHGLAGSSHVLGVLPALAFPTKLQAGVYLAAYGVGSIAAMALFSWGMGWVTTRLGARGIYAYRGLMGGSAVVALGVGGFWLATSWA